MLYAVVPASPFVWFLSIKHHVPANIATALVLASLVLPILLVQDSTDPTWNAAAMTMRLAAVVRILDCFTMHSIIVHMNGPEFARYLVAFQIPKTLVRLVPARKPSHLETLAVPYSSMSMGYFARELPVAAVKFLVYCGIITYMRTNRAEWNPAHMAMPSSWKDAVDVYLLGLALAMMMDVMVFAALHLNSLVFRTSYYPCMNQPYLSRSVSDFWACRWNLIAQQAFARYIFLPVLAMAGTKRASVVAKAAAALVTFLVSSVIHEWTLKALLANPSSLEQTAFFMVHGIITVLEHVVWTALKAATGIDAAKAVPLPVQIIYSQSVLALTAPLFLNPMIRENLYFKIGFV
ncbi:hypothetical protein HDU91_007136 [Kappamyces sp. JEL0680]|nr:hypothetical protein HDU91_007136 [Kappamyces sp. JEL0680]